MLNKFFKMFVGLAFLSYAATSIAMESPRKGDADKEAPAKVSKNDVKNLLKAAAWYAPDALNMVLGGWRFWYSGYTNCKDIFSQSWASRLPSIADLNETMLSKEMISMIQRRQ